MNDTLDIGLMPLFVVIGSFYVFAGVVASRAVLMDAVLDMALSGITADGRDPLDVERSGWMLASACVVGASGVLLAAGSWLALPVFLLSCTMQVLHFALLSPKRYDVEDPVSPQGRQQSLNAFGLYVIVTVFVAWATFYEHLGKLAGWNHNVSLALGVAWLGASIWAFHYLLTLHLPTSTSRSDDFRYGDEEGPPDSREQIEAAQLWAKTAHVVLAPSCALYLLIDREDNLELDYEKTQALNFPDNLTDDMTHYVAMCRRVIDHNDPLRQSISSIEDAEGLQICGEDLFARLRNHLGDRVSFSPHVRPNLPKQSPTQLNIIGVPWSSGVFENWPIMNGDDGLWFNDLGISQNLLLEMNEWIDDANGLFHYETNEILPDASPQRLVEHVDRGRAIAMTIAKEFRATERGQVPITYHPRGGAPEEINI